MFDVIGTMRSAALGNIKRLVPMIIWSALEGLVRGLPWGIAIAVIWEIFKPLEDPSVSFDNGSMTGYTIGLVVMCILLALVSIKTYFTTYYEGYQLCGEGRAGIVEHLRKLPMGFFNSKDPGEIGAYIVTDYANIEMLITHLVPQIFAAFLLPLVVMIYILVTDWRMGLIAVAVVPLGAPFSFLSQWLIKTTGTTHKKAQTECSSRMLEYVHGIKLIKAHNMGGTKFERLEKAFRVFMTESIKVEGLGGPVMVFSSIVLNAGFIILMIVGIPWILDGSLSIQNYVMIIVIAGRIYDPLVQAFMFLGEMSYMSIGVERTEALRNTKPLPDGTETFTGDSEIEFKDVVFSYNNKAVINHLDAKIPAGKLTALVGPSGSGKTTLTRLIARFWDVDSGEIIIGGKNIKNYKSDNLLSQISIVFQDVYLFNDTVYNNIRIGNQNATKEEIIKVAKAAQCHEFIEAMPNGYDEMIGEGGCTLSGGEKQRISIARAMLKNAPIILLDEATASLDPENELSIQRAINDLVKDKTVIVIAHRLNTIRRADQILVLKEGKLEESGNHDQLIEKNGLYSELWTEQQKLKGWKF